jgi:DNA-binding transcriptional ArsR family regulator
MESCHAAQLNREGVERARGVVENSRVEEVADLFAALADPTRVRILRALSVSEFCVCELTELLSDLTQSAISHQLRLLRGARLVRSRRQGRQIFYAMDDDHVEALMQQAMEHAVE